MSRAVPTPAEPGDTTGRNRPKGDIVEQRRFRNCIVIVRPLEEPGDAVAAPRPATSPSSADRSMPPPANWSSCSSGSPSRSSVVEEARRLTAET
jgi:hypothetical protein